MIDAVFRDLPVVYFPGSKRGAVKVENYLELVERSTYRDDRVRLSISTPASIVRCARVSA